MVVRYKRVNKLDTYLNFICQIADEDKLLHARIPVAFSMIDAFEHGKERRLEYSLKLLIELQCGIKISEITLEDWGSWDNIANREGKVRHPFKNRYLREDDLRGSSQD